MNEGMDAFSRPYMRDIVRLQDTEVQLNLIQSELQTYRVLDPEDCKVAEADLAATPRTTHGRDLGRRLETVEAEVKEVYNKLAEQVGAEKLLAAQVQEEQERFSTLKSYKNNFCKQGASDAEAKFRERE